MTLLVGTGDTIIRILTGATSLLQGGAWLQAIVPFAQLEVRDIIQTGDKENLE